MDVYCICPCIFERDEILEAYRDSSPARDTFQRCRPAKRGVEGYPATASLEGLYEAAGQIGQDKPTPGRRWSHCSAPLLYIGQTSPEMHRRNSMRDWGCTVHRRIMVSRRNLCFSNAVQRAQPTEKTTRVERLKTKVEPLLSSYTKVS